MHHSRTNKEDRNELAVAPRRAVNGGPPDREIIDEPAGLENYIAVPRPSRIVVVQNCLIHRRVRQGSFCKSAARQGQTDAVKLFQFDRTQLFRIFQAEARTAGLPFEKRHPHVLKCALASQLVACSINHKYGLVPSAS